MSKKRLFLLGGQDLEMIEIKNLLISNNEKFEDKSLSWGAKLSDYQEFLDFDETIYGVELEADITPPENYVEIDHHGKNDDKLSSLEQVAEILKIKLDDNQMLIAKNDSRYIGGMKSLCATQEQIDEIRAKDRKAQGITQEDEELAKASFDIALCNKSNCIFSETPKFSAVSDLAYYKFDNYIIYNDNKIVFYGYKKENILEFLKSQNINEADYYYGGGEFGFVGIKKNILDKTKIKELLEEFKKVENQDELYSYHTFMLPFIFKGKFDKKENWEYKQYKVDNQKDFNEFIYFYKHVQDALYNTGKESENCISNYYEWKQNEGTYTINCKKGIFELQLDGISLRIFNTNVAILSFNLKNKKYADFESILAVNDFGRRIYPQFLGQNFTCDTKQAILANSIALTFEDENPIVENFTKFDTKENLHEINILPEFVTKLIKDNFSKDEETQKTSIRPIIDDRMFVLSQCHDDKLIEKLKIYNRTDEYEYETDDQWYEYIFIDGDGKTCQSKHMSKKLINESTYDRWIDWGTLFGISRYSFVALTGSWFGKNRLLPHMQTMYFQMFTLLLAYRATIIKFADDIQDATANDNEITEKTKAVYKRYLNFLNKLYFKEITAQDQGIELYNQAMKIMDIEKYMTDLDNEINELHNYANMIEEKKRNDTLGFISKMGAVMLPPSLLAGLFGMNVLTIEATEKNQLIAIVFIICSALIGLMLTLDWKIFKNFKTNIKKILKIVGFTILPIAFVLYFLNSFNLPLKNLNIDLLFGMKLDKKADEPQNVNITNEPTVILKTNGKQK